MALHINRCRSVFRVIMRGLGYSFTFSHSCVRPGRDMQRQRARLYLTITQRGKFVQEVVNSRSCRIRDSC